MSLTRALLFLEDAKGEEMESIKKFINDYKKEIVVVGIGMVIYNMGFRKGYKSAEEAMYYLIKESAKALEVAKANV